MSSKLDSRLSVGSPGSQRSRATRTATVAIAVVAMLLAVLCARMMDRREAALDGAHALVRLERVPAPELGPRFERWRMIGSRADTVVGLWRPAAPRLGTNAHPAAVEWTVVLLGGIGTNDRAALLVPDSLPVGVLAVSWPWTGPRRMSRWEFTVNAPAIRAALLRTPEALARGVVAVRRVTTETRVAMVGASLGAPPTAVAVPLSKPDALVLVDGAADIARLLRSEATHALGGGRSAAVLAGLVAPIAAWWLSPLEPGRLAGTGIEVPTLLVDAEQEDRLPHACVVRLHAVFPHATLATHPGGHLRPHDQRQIGSTLATVWGWLEGVGRSERPAGEAARGR